MAGPTALRRGALLALLSLALLTRTQAARADGVTLHVGDQKAGLKALLEVSGGTKDLPYAIDWSEFPAAAPILEALNAGALDVGYTGDLAFLTVVAAGAPVRAIGGSRSDPASQAILVAKDSPVRTLQDLKGRTAAGNKGGWGHFLILAALQRDGIDAKEVKLAFLGPMDAKPALASGSVDAWAVWEPYVSIAQLNDGARVIADGRGLTPTVTFIVANQSAIAAKHAALADLVRRLRAGWTWAQGNLPAYAAYNARLTGVPEPIILHAYQGQKTAPIVLDDAVVAEVQRAADLSLSYGILSKPVDVASVVDRSFPVSAEVTQ